MPPEPDALPPPDDQAPLALDGQAPLVLDGAADVVAALPFLLGHEPARCLAVLAVRESGRLGVVARVDLASGLAPVRRLVEAVVADQPASVVVAVYDDSDPGEPAGRATAAAARCAVRGLARAGVEVADLLRVGPERWRSARCPERGCCDRTGHGLDRTRRSPVAVRFVVSGRAPAPDRASLEAPSPDAPDAARRAAATGAARWRRRVRASDDGICLDERRRLLDEWLRAVEDHRRSGTLPGPTATGRLAAAWSDDVRVRDACMAAVLPGAGLTPDGVTAGSVADLADVLADPACAGAVVGPAPLLRHMAAHVRGASRAAVLSVHAWLAWASGDGAAAGDLADRAVAEDADHGLAVLVRQVVDRAVPPGWAVPEATAAGAGRVVAVSPRTGRDGAGA